MINIFKKKKITVDCFTYHNAINELFPIKDIKYFYPEWFKKLKETYTQSSFLGLTATPYRANNQG